MTPTKWKDAPKAAYKRITFGLKQFKNQSVFAGKLILEAKERKIWEVEGFSSFKEWVEKACGFSERWAYELIQTEATKKEIAEESSRLNQVQPQSEENKGKTPEKVSTKKCPALDELTKRQRQELDGLKPAEKAEAFQIALAESDGEPPTPEMLAAAVQQVARNGEPEVFVDRTGHGIIPDKILADWKRATAQGKEWLNRLDALKRDVVDKFGKDFALEEIKQSNWHADIQNVRDAIKQTIPYAVCIQCQGRSVGTSRKKPEDRCVCFDRGWVSKFLWGRAPTDIIKVREKAFAVHHKDRSYASP